ncbi:MAG: type II toxin-antitoxin system PemK/MazF family toxin [Campylobacterales bacterium]|nr:type II toxin-antitoxin system PemK/MazF family toxin [Campylobacterales bacterium]
MVGNIYFISMPYSDFTKAKARPVLVFQTIDKNDLLILPLTSSLTRDGILITSDDIQDGTLKKDSVVIVPKLIAIDSNLILGSRFIASLKESSFTKVKNELCLKLGC